MWNTLRDLAMQDLSDEVQMRDLSATASTSSSSQVRLWNTLHNLAMQSKSDEVYSNIADERLVSNDINIQFYPGKAVEHTTRPGHAGSV